jgi:hypothetical protein
MNYQEDDEDEKMTIESKFYNNSKMKTKRWNLNCDHYDDDLHFAPKMKTIKTIKMKTQFFLINI